jgi:hypothetical protein
MDGQVFHIPGNSKRGYVGFTGVSTVGTGGAL